MVHFSELIRLEEAFNIIDRLIKNDRIEFETIHVLDAVGRFLRKNIISKLDLPPFNRSAMDGYAIIDGDIRETYKVLETIPAGSVCQSKLGPGTTVKVMTGAPVPEGAGKVIKIEDTTEKDGIISVHNHQDKTNIARKGEDLKTGDIIYRSGHCLDEVDISTLVSSGNTHVKVSKPVKIAIIVTGDEIVNSFDEITPGKIMNSNGPLLRVLCSKYKLNVVYEDNINDKPRELLDAINKAIKMSDVIILSGGVSVGDYDYVPEILEQCGLAIKFRGVLIKPGKPITCASNFDTIALGLPGNPVAVYVTYHLFVLRVVKLISGGTPSQRKITLPLKSRFTRKRAKRKQFVPCYIDTSGRLIPAIYHGSGHFASLIQTDGFFIIPENVFEIDAGEIVEFISYSILANNLTQT